jgi:hypothetical protein
MAALSTSIRCPIVAKASAFAGRKVQCSAAATNGATTTARAVWMPGSTPPSYLDGSLPW